MSEASSPIESVTLVNDPIRSVHPLRRFEFVRAPLDVSADAALVLVGADGTVVTYAAGHQPTRGELAWRNYVKLYKVDLGHHHQFFDYDLPSVGDAFFFHTEVDVSWHVENPEIVVRHGVHDVRATIEPVLRKVLTSRTRRFKIEETAAAEVEVNRALEEACIGGDLGLRVNCIVRLTLDTQALEHFTTLRQQRYQTVQDAEQHITAQAAAKQTQELTQQNIEFFRRLLRDEDAMWALLLDRNPDNATTVLEGLRNDEQQALATKAQLILKLFESGHLEDHMFEEPARMAAETLHEILAKATDGTSMQRPLHKQQLPQRDHGADDED